MDSTTRRIINQFAMERPVNIEGLIEALGLELVRKADLDKEIAGQIQKLENDIYRISVNKNDHYFRRRFTMAHELGHYLYHKGIIGDGVDDDRLYRNTQAGDFYNSAIKQQHEVEANKFAAAILMPKPKVQKDYYEFNDLNKVAALWQVSPQALKIRLGLTDE